MLQGDQAALTLENYKLNIHRIIQYHNKKERRKEGKEFLPSSWVSVRKNKTISKDNLNGFDSKSDHSKGYNTNYLIQERVAKG